MPFRAQLNTAGLSGSYRRLEKGMMEQWTEEENKVDRTGIRRRVSGDGSCLNGSSASTFSTSESCCLLSVISVLSALSDRLRSTFDMYSLRTAAGKAAVGAGLASRVVHAPLSARPSSRVTTTSLPSSSKLAVKGRRLHISATSLHDNPLARIKSFSCPNGEGRHDMVLSLLPKGQLK